MGQVIDRADKDLTEHDPNLNELRNRTFPSKEGETIQLPDGRLLGFSEYVHPSDDKRRDELHVILMYAFFFNIMTVLVD